MHRHDPNKFVNQIVDDLRKLAREIEQDICGVRKHVIQTSVDVDCCEEKTLIITYIENIRNEKDITPIA